MDVISKFLSASAATCQAVWKLHDMEQQQDSTRDSDLAIVSSTLREAINSLLCSRVTGADGTVSLFNSCRKVARDLAIRLDRAEDSARVQCSTVIRESQLRQVWTIDVVIALVPRLITLMRQYQGASPRSDILLANEQSLLRLKFDIPQNRETDRDGEQQDHLVTPEPQPSRRAPDSVPKSIAIDVSLFLSNKTTKRNHASTGLLNEFILDTLMFDNMTDRLHTVAKAHGKTFEWIFSADNSRASEREDFCRAYITWLETNDLGSIYWMTGKPGSGKSTLMKYLFEHSETQNMLQKWAGERLVSTAGFFSWASGSREQRSRIGLMRSLLHQLLSASPQLISRTFPSLWDRIRTMTSKERIALHLDWDLDELLEAFRLFLDAAVPEMNTCLFIDGLDEFDETYHQDLVTFFENIGHAGKIKMCLSSRPWDIFESAFQSVGLTVRLQDISRRDLYQYAIDRLGDGAIARRVLPDANIENICHSLVERANGVFLWIQLALNQLLDGLDDQSDLCKVLKRVNELPGELDNLYEKMLFQDQSADELAETGSLFALMNSREVVADFVNNMSARSLTIWELAFAINGQDDDDMATHGLISEASDTFVQERCIATVEIILQRFANLVSVHSRSDEAGHRTQRFADKEDVNADARRQLADHRVAFVHRTVYDWLHTTHVHERLKKSAPMAFDPHLRLLRSYVIRLKRQLQEVQHHRRFDEWWPDVTLAMTHARSIVQDETHSQCRLLNELNKTLSWLWDANENPYDHWAAKAFGFFHVRKTAPPIWHPFLCLAIKFGLVTFVAEEVEKCIRQDGKYEQQQTPAAATIPEAAVPLLAYATEFLCSRKRTVYPLSSPRLVRELLNRPHDRINPGPNYEYTDSEFKIPVTPWVSVLRHLRDARRRRWIEYFDYDADGMARWAEIVHLLIAEGSADTDAVVAADHWEPATTATRIIALLADTYGASELESIKLLFQPNSA